MTCSCGTKTVVIFNDAPKNYRDKNGVIISEEAAIHMSKYRVGWCSGCQKQFCGGCREKPYHVGFTCEQFLSYKMKIKCRFCRAILKQTVDSSNDPFSKVCDGEECQRLMQQSCDKILDCGHLCKGIRDENPCLPCLDEKCVHVHGKFVADTKDDNYCEVCYCEELGERPCIQVQECRHVFHFDCISKRIREQIR